jgi:hypothetical protein
MPKEMKTLLDAFNQKVKAGEAMPLQQKQQKDKGRTYQSLKKHLSDSAGNGEGNNSGACKCHCTRKSAPDVDDEEGSGSGSGSGSKDD